MPRHPSVPENLTGWIHLGVASTDTAMFAIVAPELAGILGDEWASRYVGDDGEPLPEPAGPAEHELVEFEEIPVGDQDHAVLFATGSDGGYLVEGRFGEMYGDGHMSLTEVRIRVWGCACTCHEEDPENTCDGDCHDEDPAPRASESPSAE
jgi:hypothetical protein